MRSDALSTSSLTQVGASFTMPRGRRFWAAISRQASARSKRAGGLGGGQGLDGVALGDDVQGSISIVK